jgi:hypothetical protein
LKAQNQNHHIRALSLRSSVLLNHPHADYKRIPNS